MLEIIDHIREYAALQKPEPRVRETYFAYNEQTGQWITSNEEVAPVLLLLQFVEANTIRDNTTFQVIAQWVYTTTVGDNAIRPYQQQALHELQKLTHYLAGNNDVLPLYEIAGARYTTIHTEQPYIAAGATVTWTLTAKDFFFQCCDDLPAIPENLECQVCPAFDLQTSIDYAINLGAGFVAPNVVPTEFDALILAFRMNGANLTDPSQVPNRDSFSYVDSNGVTSALGTTGGGILGPQVFYLEVQGQISNAGTIYLKFEGCDPITIPIPSTP